ncbi:aromatic ring-hydroxylating oxygenase subunit alpha [Novosphingobium lentum]|uniref:aromatic ring-hydroxylating oxygenase subunit alpha n=1 Tax=Novosphingobium lentum TaxID=145287 RepID=UPI00082F3145|nr:aromatic ring-hydroxylating dioxygenase subunit alpha [Novosphingobium lentum]
MDVQQLGHEHYPGNTWQDIAASDGGDLPPVLRAQSNPAQDLRPIPFERYNSPAFFDAEIERMWKRVWQFACREEHLREVGDFYVYDLARLSIVIVRAPEGLKAYRNSCRHRGTKLKPSNSTGWSQTLRCPFHAWEWSLDGGLVNRPCDWEFPHLPAADAGLRPVQVDSWNGFVFINMSAEAPPLLEYLEVLPDHFKRWDMTGWYVHTHVRKHVPANWKLAQAAFMEAYHTPFVHPEMTHVVGDHNMQHDIFSDHISRDLCAMAVPSPTAKTRLGEQEMLDAMLVGDGAMIGERTQVPPGMTARQVMADRLRTSMQADFGLDYADFSVAEMIDSLKYSVFPNVMFYPSPGLALIQQFRPDGHDPDRAIFDQMVLRPILRDGEFEVGELVEIGEHETFASVPSVDPFLASVLDQDTDIMRWQREGMYASDGGGEVLSVYQESRIRHLHDTLDKYLEKTT